MSPGRLNIAVVGHTNVGKTSLMRTLTRARDFGEVSPRPATTQRVDKAEIRLPAGHAVLLYDTPGLEDSTGLLAHLDTQRQETGLDWTDVIDRFCAEPAAQGPFTQEAQALAQMRASDVALYVVDIRQPVRAKHRDELEILGRCARPVVPVFNFAADPDADDAHWREQLARVNMHAIAAFDTVVFDEAGELALYRKIATLSDRFAPVLQALIDDLAARRADLKRASARIVADLCLRVAAAQERFPKDDDTARDAALSRLKERVRTRERRAVADLLALHRFGPDDYLPADLPISGGVWGDDPFDPQALERFGLDTGRAVAAGAAAGVAVDLMVGGLTLGAAAATGAGLGFLADWARKHGAGLQDRVSGRLVLRADDRTVRLIAGRSILLTRALLARGHGAQEPIKAEEARDLALDGVIKALRPARREGGWADSRGEGPPRRQACLEAAADRVLALIDT